jgi:hypothetical protein
MLTGDTNRNKIVNATDVAQAKAEVGVAITSANFREHLNDNGGISARLRGNCGV